MNYSNITLLNNRLFNTLLTALAPIIWGTTYIVTTELLPSNKPLLAAVIRVLPVGILLVLWAKKLPIYRHNSEFDKYILIKMMTVSFLNITCFQALLFIAAYRLLGGIAAVIGSVQPLIILLLISMTTKSLPKLSTVLVVFSSIIGMVLLLIKDNVELDVVGVIAAFLGAISMAVGMFLTKLWKPNVDNLTFTGWQLLFGGLMLLPFMLIFEELPQKFSTANIFGYAYLAVVGSLIAYTLWFRGIAKINMVAVSILGTFSPITATIIGWFYLQQALTPIQMFGFFTVISSVTVVQIISMKNDVKTDISVIKQKITND